MNWLFIDFAFQSIMLLSILYQDLKERKVSLWILMLLFGYGIFRFKVFLLPINFIVINALIIAIQIIVIMVYSKMKFNSLNFLKNALGEGDIFFWCILVIFLSPLNFIIFFILSLIISLFIHYAFSNAKAQTIPLAGYQSLCLFVINILDITTKSFNIQSDEYWLIIFTNGY